MSESSATEESSPRVTSDDVSPDSAAPSSSPVAPSSAGAASAVGPGVVVSSGPGAGPLVSIDQPAEQRYRPSYSFLIIVTVLNLVADLWSKHWAKSTFEVIKAGHPRKVVVIDGVMNFIYAQNFGGAWGLLQKADESLRRPFFLAVSVAAIVFIVSLYRKLRPGQTALKWGLPLVLGGALGNLVDRVRYGFVVDFIDVYVSWDGKPSHWPTFNVADIAICVGVVLMAVDMFSPRPKKAASVSSEELQGPSSAATLGSLADSADSDEAAAPEAEAARDVAG